MCSWPSIGSTSSTTFIESSGLTVANPERTQMVSCFFVVRMEKTEYRFPGTKTSLLASRARPHGGHDGEVPSQPSCRSERADLQWAGAVTRLAARTLRRRSISQALRSAAMTLHEANEEEQVARDRITY